ncbi:branched-chain amino acid aminotransferase 1, mitochondrial-like [Humulus lupulus]|uniref:branched-chain amino acid aminotransferase 1, mitochondrial-like n=1 Tax=Humulus lupulus TaxID=3486 RepID=UPI002B401411|nr:branched-chain amino acid aminotransferase 1, mitochondrial-like [Humulus lupulus]
MIYNSLRLRNLVQSFRAGSSTTLSKFGSHKLTSKATSPLQQEFEQFRCSDDDRSNVEWDKLGFGVMPTDYMYSMKCSNDGNFQMGRLTSYANIELSPSAGVLNYGQGVFEGTKAYRKEDGRLLMFRPDKNGVRMKIGAERMCMPSPSVDQFVEAVRQTVLANKRWVPPCGKGSLYVRPLLMGTGPVLGLAPAPEYTFLVYASPVGNYFKEGLAPLSLYVEDEFDRASRGGTGFVKTISNYSPVLKALNRAKNKGFSDVLYLDSVDKRYIEEASSSNIFTVKGDLISTPATNGTILSGVTRRSIIEIALDHGYKVKECNITVDELMEADEVFCPGTAVVVASVSSITYHNRRVGFKTGSQTVSHKLYTTLIGIQRGVIEDKKGWIVEIV